MPFNGSGTFLRTFPSGGWQGDATANIKIRADRHDQHDNDLASGISNAICKDGQSSPTADIPFNGKKIINLGAPINPADAATKGYVDGRFGQIFTISGTDEAGRIIFSGSQSPLASGKPLGISWTQADLFFGVKPANVEASGQLPRFVWNDKGDGMGQDMMTLSDDHVLTLISKDAGASTAPSLNILRDSASPAVSDGLGLISFQGKNVGGTTINYGGIATFITDPAVASEDANLYLRQMTAGVMTNRLEASAIGVRAIGNLIAGGAGNPSVSAHSTDRATAYGFWNSTSYLLAFGAMDGNGSPFATWGYFNAANGDFHSQYNVNVTGYITAGGSISATGNISSAASISATGSVNAAGALSANNGLMYFGVGGSGEIMQFNSGWYWDWNSVNGDLKWVAGGVTALTITAAGNITIAGQAYKPGGGSWQSTSDLRLKDVHGAYDKGLDELLQINPVRYNYKTDPDREYIGIIAQEIEGILPETVAMTAGEVDGETVDDLRSFDPSALLYVAINAIKELSAKVEALEAQLAGAP